MIRSCLMISKGLGSNHARLFLRNCHNNAIPFSWEKPDIGCIKLNFDGSKVGGNNASIGGVYRNHEGAFLLGYAERIGKATSSVAELIAARRGLELALENGWLNIWLEGDAKNVVDFVVGKGLRMESEEDIRHAREIKVLVSQLDVLNASHIYRQGNKVADKFAKMGYNYTLNKPKIWRDVPPDEVSRFLQQDAEGRVFLRKR